MMFWTSCEHWNSVFLMQTSDRNAELQNKLLLTQFSEIYLMNVNVIENDFSIEVYLLLEEFVHQKQFPIITVSSGLRPYRVMFNVCYKYLKQTKTNVFLRREPLVSVTRRDYGRVFFYIPSLRCFRWIYADKEKDQNVDPI